MIALTEEEQYQKYGELEKACTDFNLSQINALLEEGVIPSNPIWEKKHNTSCLEAVILAVQATEEQRIALIQKLCAKGADLHVRNSMGTLLVRATCIGSLKIAQFLVDNGIDVNAANDGNFTALHYVHIVKSAEFLLGKGANLFIKNDIGKTPRECCESEKVRLLLLAKEEALKPKSPEIIHKIPIYKHIKEDLPSETSRFSLKGHFGLRHRHAHKRQSEHKQNTAGSSVKTPVP